MAKTPAQTLITDLCNRMGWGTTGTARVDALRHLNIAEKWISQRHSLLYLSARTTIVLLSAGSSALVPSSPACDIGKAITIGYSGTGGDGNLVYVPIDEFDDIALDLYGDWNSTKPGYFTIGVTADANLTPTFYFKPANTSGGNLTLNIRYQMLVSALTDSGVSYSTLPEGYEDTILIDRAEAEAKRMKREPGWEELHQQNRQEIEEFYGSYRATKEVPATATEQKDRKYAREKLAEGV